MDKKSTGSIVALIVIIILVIATINSINNRGSNYNSMSSEYNSNSSYRKNVNDIANTFGTSSAEVDRKINAVVDAMNSK